MVEGSSKKMRVEEKSREILTDCFLLDSRCLLDGIDIAKQVERKLMHSGRSRFEKQTYSYERVDKNKPQARSL